MGINSLEICEENVLNDLYLRDLSLGNIQGPMTGYPSKDKPWLKYYTKEAVIAKMPTVLSIYEYIKEKNSTNNDKMALRCFNSVYTYEELFKMIDEYASRFEFLGVNKGDIVSVCMPSTPETVFSIYALNKLGAICDMIDPRSNVEQMEYYLNENKSKLLILCENYYETMKLAIEKSKIKKTILYSVKKYFPFSINVLMTLKNKKRNSLRNSRLYEEKEFLMINSTKIIDSKRNDKDLALIIHSSGTTSIPKGIMLTNSNVNAIAFQYDVSPLRTEANSIFLSVIPAFASFGVVASINLPLSLSMQTILAPVVNPNIFVNLMKKYRPNFTLTIPANLIKLSKSNKIKDLSFFYGPGCGGYSLDSTKEGSINDYLKTHNSPSPMLMGWGLSECASTVTIETPECSKPLSSGIPLVKNIVSIFEPDTDHELQYNIEGEVCVSGPSIMYGYLNNPEKTNKVIRKHKDGTVWLHSGDIGYMDTDGRVIPIERMDRMIVKGQDGFKICPQKIEEIVSSSLYIDSCVVVGSNGEYGIIPKCYMVLKKEYVNVQTKALDDVIKLCHERLSIRAIPDEFEFIAELPYTSMGKVDYKSLENKNIKKIVKRK